VHFCDDGHIVPAEIGAEGNDARLGVHDAGNADAYSLHFVHGVSAGFNSLDGKLCHVTDDGLVTTFYAGGAAFLAENNAIFIDDAGFDAGTAQIDADIDHNHFLR